MTGLGVAQQMGLTVPDDVSIVGWDDSLISQVVHPPLTAITRDIEAYGSAATRHLLAAIAGERAALRYESSSFDFDGKFSTSGTSWRRSRASRWATSRPSGVS